MCLKKRIAPLPYLTCAAVLWNGSIELGVEIYRFPFVLLSLLGKYRNR